jgi:GDP-mannose pyrophosphatase NudK
MSSIRITNTETLYQGKSVLQKVTYEQTTAEGEVRTLDRDVFKRANATTILLYDPQRKKVLLTEQVRVPVLLNNKNGNLLEACAGLIDEGELPEHSIIREVEEETGYRISHILKIFEAYSSPGAYTECVHYFLGEYSPDLKVSDGGGIEHEGEDVKTVEISFQEARELLSSGKIRDAKTIILLQYAILHNMI